MVGQLRNASGRYPATFYRWGKARSIHPCTSSRQNGWISSKWAVSENNRRAKYYTLTKAGRKAMDQEAAQWVRLSTAIALVVGKA